MNLFEIVDRNILRRVINIEYHNDQDVLIEGMKNKKQLKIQNKDSYMIDKIDPHILTLLYKKHVYSSGIESLDVEITIRIKMAMRRDKRETLNFRTMDISPLLEENIQQIFMGVAQTISAVLANMMMTFGENPLIIPPKLNFKD